MSLSQYTDREFDKLYGEYVSMIVTGSQGGKPGK